MFDKGRYFVRRKVCKLCVDKVEYVDYKDIATLRYFLTDRAKIMPRGITGNCSHHQKVIARAVKQARNIALLPFVDSK